MKKGKIFLYYLSMYTWKSHLNIYSVTSWAQKFNSWCKPHKYWLGENKCSTKQEKGAITPSLSLTLDSANVITGKNLWTHQIQHEFCDLPKAHSSCQTQLEIQIFWGPIIRCLQPNHCVIGFSMIILKNSNFSYPCFLHLNYQVTFQTIAFEWSLFYNNCWIPINDAKN